MAILTLAAKDLRLLVRDPRSAVILLLTPLLLILVLGLALGEGFGEKPDERLRISIVDLDRGLPSGTKFPKKRWSEIVIDDLSATQNIRLEIITDPEEAKRLIAKNRRPAVIVFGPDFSDRMQRSSFLANADPPPVNPLGRDGADFARLDLQLLTDKTQPVSASVIEQVTQVTLLRVVIPWMIGKAFQRVGDPDFMTSVTQRLSKVKPIPPDVVASLNPVMQKLMAALLSSPKFGELVLTETGLQEPATVAKVFQEISPVMEKLLSGLMKDPEFAAMMIKEVGFADATTIAKRGPEFQKVMKKVFQSPKLLERISKDVAFGDVLRDAIKEKEFQKVVLRVFEKVMAKDSELLTVIGKDLSLGEVMTPEVRNQVGPAVKDGVGDMFSNYNFEATTWDQLVKSNAREASEANRVEYHDTAGSGFLNRGALRYQILVPSYTVMFAFFLVLSVGWLFVAERKHGTLVRLRAAPLTRAQILLGKLLPCLAVSLIQGFFLLAAGRIIFGMTWGSRPELLLPLVFCTSFAAVGLAVLVASVARTETQVAVYGTLIVLVLGGVSGSLMPRDLMPEQMKTVSLVTPHAWALDAYAQLLASPTPDASAVLTSCGVLLAFGLVFTMIAWWKMDLE